MRFAPPAIVALGLACTAHDCQGGGPKPARYEQSQVHMGTTFRIVFYCTTEASASRAAQSAFDRIAQLDAMMSDYSDTSELTLLSQSSGGPARAVSPELFEVLRRSIDLSKRTQGAFDVTIGPAVRLWRRARRLRQLPTHDQISRALQRVGYQRIQLDRQQRTVRLDTPGMLLDLGGIAKGYACDAALRVLAEHGIERALVDGGGDISVSGPPPGAAGWKIALQPLNVAGQSKAITEHATGETATLHHAAIATSGDTSQYVELDGKHYSHIVDPKTGIGLTSRCQVTVIARDGTTADALASAVSVLGPDKGIALIDATPHAACLVTQHTPTGLQTYPSRGWRQLAEPPVPCQN